jgi:hypothetical protein
VSTLSFSPLALWLWTTAAAQTPPAPTTQVVNPTTFTSARICGECHQAIHAVWQRSTHATSFTNGVFQAAYEAAKKNAGEPKARVCLDCHAPTVRKTQDYAALDPITREGVSCDFCHSIRSISMSGSESLLDMTLGRIKYGPLRYAKSPAHEVIPTDLHRKSEFCAPCHEYRNPHGVAVLETYSEWKASPYAAEGKQCQHCHMPMIPGRTVAPGLPSTLAQGVNLHNISGSHDLEQVRKAVTLEILSIERVGYDRLSVQIAVSNVGSGHCFPTGLPMHRAILELNVSDRGRSVARRDILFEKVLLNARGALINHEDEAFLEARSISRDTRLKPRERRIIPITFRDVVVPEGLVEATLWYQYDTRVLRSKNGEERVEPVNMKILLASGRRAVPRSGR